MPDFKRFFSLMWTSMGKPSGYPQMIGGGSNQAAHYFLVVFILGICLSWVGVVASAGYSYITLDIDEALAKVPEYEIKDGKMMMGANVKQPLYLSPYIVLDTTGVVTEVPQGPDGSGMLITRTEVLHHDGTKLNNISIADIEGIAPNKGELIASSKWVLILVMGLVVLMALVLRFIMLFAVSLAIWALLCITGYIGLILWKKEPCTGDICIAGIYSLTPTVVFLGIGAWFLGWFFGILGILWSVTVFGLALGHMHGGGIVKATVSPEIRDTSGDRISL